MSHILFAEFIPVYGSWDATWLGAQNDAVNNSTYRWLSDGSLVSSDSFNASYPSAYTALSAVYIMGRDKNKFRDIARTYKLAAALCEAIMKGTHFALIAHTSDSVPLLA